MKRRRDNIKHVCNDCASDRFTPVNWDTIPRDDVTFVKVGFQKEEDGATEWMWVQVDTFHDNGTITGTLDNNPTLVDSLTHGDTVTVGEDDVVDVMTRRPPA